MADLILRPNSDNSIGIESPAEDDHYIQIDEETADDSGSYVQQIASQGSDEEDEYHTDLYGLPDSDVQGDITKVTVYARMWGDAFTTFKFGIKTHGTVYSETDNERSETWTTFSDEYTTNPNTGSAWTWQEIDDLLLYLSLRPWTGGSYSSATVRCTQMYVKVTYTPANEPTVTTDATPSAKDHESATLDGNVTDDDDRDITERGFEYKEGADGEIQTVSEESADFGTGAYSLEITGLDPNVEYYYRAYAVNEIGTGYGDWESFTTDKTTPTLTAQAPTDILPTTATANGNITCDGGEDCSERGFEYGLTKVATWTVTDDAGGYSTGAFTKDLTGLTANTTYWIRAYAVNTEGTGYSEWIQFQTAAAGVIPTGTKLNICSDYSGYTYQLMRSETDDGEEYTAYFVISTDLANKQGLAYYKRILDLHFYFNKEDSGTVDIYVKKDSETDWEDLGSVSLTGDDDIVIKHLAVDIRAKHFLFKISAANHFEFLGMLFEYIPVGMR